MKRVERGCTRGEREEYEELERERECAFYPRELCHTHTHTHTPSFSPLYPLGYKRNPCVCAKLH